MRNENFSILRQYQRNKCRYRENQVDIRRSKRMDIVRSKIKIFDWFFAKVRKFFLLLHDNRRLDGMDSDHKIGVARSYSRHRQYLLDKRHNEPIHPQNTFKL